MLINEIVNNTTQSLTEKLQYDSSKLSDVKMDKVTYKWDSNARVYREPDGSIVDTNGPLFYDLIRHKDNINARVGGTPGDWQDRMARKGVVKGTRSAIANKIGLSGMGKSKRLDPKAGLGAKIGATAGEYIGKGMDKIHNFVKGAVGNAFKKDPKKPKDDVDIEFEKRGWVGLEDPKQASRRIWKAGDKDDRKMIKWVAPRSPENSVGSQETFNNIKQAIGEYYMQKELGPVYDLPYMEKINHPKYLAFIAKWKVNPIFKATPSQGFKNPFFGATISKQRGYNSSTTRITNPGVHPFTSAGMERLGTGAQGQGFLPNDPIQQKRYLNMQDSEKGIELLKNKVRTQEITMDQAGEVLQFVQGIHPSQKTKQPTTFQKAWKMWYVTSPQYKQALDKNKKERQKILKQVDKVNQDNEKIRGANAQMPLNQRVPQRKSFLLGPDGKPLSVQ